MFECKFAKMYDNSIFEKYNVTPIAEDYFKVEGNAFCVADGVTRDTIEGQAVPYPKNREEVLEWIKNYPNPSGALEAAKVVAETFVSLVKQQSEQEISKQTIMQLAKETNREVAKINAGRKIDYLKEDYYCCEAVGGIIIDNTLYCFSMGDCHITVLDKEYDTIFTTINNHKQFEDYLDSIYSKENSFNWNHAEDRIMVRKEFRNNPDKKWEGKDISFGAFSGEENAEYYIDAYAINLEQAAYICAYSDGCEPNFETKDIIKDIIEHPEKLEQEGKERTLIIYERK